MQKALFIYNPVAGRVQLRSELWDVIRILSKRYFLVVMETQGAGDGRRFIAQNKNVEFDAVICCGGDGTLNEVVTGMLENDISVPIGYIPCGSTNDFARSLHIPTTPHLAAMKIISGETRHIDIGLLDNSKCFAYIASFGAFTRASYGTPQKEKNVFGHLAYCLNGAKDLFAIKKSPVYKAEILLSDGSSVKGEYFFGAVCNSTSIAGLVRLPDESVDLGDGLFESVFIKKPKTGKEWFALLDDLVHKRIEKNRLVEMFKVSSLTVKMDAVAWSLDGEKALLGREVCVNNQKHAIRIFV